MVVDDEPDIRELTTELLERFGYTVHTYENGQTALDAFSNTAIKFDLVLTDMTMPLMTGVDLAKAILKTSPDLPIILCSGYSKTISKQNAKELGIREFLQKPLKNHSLLAAIRKTLDT
ncbi:MAG: response regulator [Desulfobacter sp.]|nr:MAG: response regulator [Desulfobacter sp.]